MLSATQFAARLPGAGTPAVEVSDAVILRNCATGLTATPSGNQASGILIAALINEFTVIGSDGDAATLPPAVAGVVIMIANATAKSLNLYPAVGEKINGTQDSAFAVAAGKSILLFATATGSWRAVVSA